jgi:hypothetical protein
VLAKWIFKTKRDSNGHKVKKKARIVVRGYQQRKGIDNFDTFAPVVHWSIMRAILALAAQKNWNLKQFDVITAFLNSQVLEEIYREILLDFEEPGCEGKVCKLVHALYGLKQAPHAWYSRIESCLLGTSLQKSIADPNLYYPVINGKYIVVLLYVDDLFVSGDNESEFEHITSHLTKAFDMTSLGIAKLYLGVEIKYHNSGFWLHQRRYIRSLLKKFDIKNCNPVGIPMYTTKKLQAEMEELACS